MSDLMSRIHDDINDYLELCRRFGEKPVYSRDHSGPECYGAHARKLELRAERERRKAMGEKTPIETEIKLPVSEETIFGLEKKLGRADWRTQENIIYQTSTGFVRLRTDGDKTTLTIKGKNSKGKYNQRTETECAIPRDFFYKILETAKKERAIVYEKQRASYFQGDCDICLDNLDGRYFVEIEGTRKDIARNISRLGLRGIKTEKRSYDEIVGGKSDRKNSYRRS